MNGSVLARDVLAALGRVKNGRRHPGLQLDKLGPMPESMKEQATLLQSVACAVGDEELLVTLASRRAALLDRSGPIAFEAETAGPLTLHLARAAIAENAGLSLHPVHGFAFLPGSGLKGLARAHAETVWLAEQVDADKAWALIGEVFGRIRETDRWKRDDDLAPASTKIETGVGRVVFHDAWPVRWPALLVDIANNHHPDYYTKDDVAPGDWENPNPVYFLAVRPGTRFAFRVSPREPGDAALADRAAGWLMAALVHAGAGAKTAAGYGRFHLVGRPDPAPLDGGRNRLDVDLELATPAFLAGADQAAAEECTLRPATLRGVLRWWWRTLHAGHLDVATLKRLEAAVWGDTSRGSAVDVSILPRGGIRPEHFDPHAIARRLGLRSSRTGARVETLGLSYGSYGMQGQPKDQKPARSFLPAGSRWTLRLAARDTLWPGTGARVPAAAVLGQAKAALWLLARFGGIGSKARNGFGSLRDIDFKELHTIEEVQRHAAAFRAALGLASADRPAAPRSPAIEAALRAELPIAAGDPFEAAHEAGQRMQAFRQRGGLGQAERAVLGLPGRGRLAGPKGERHAAPTHLHLAPDSARGARGYRLRVTAFPVSTLLKGDDRAERATAALKRLVEFYRREPAGAAAPPSSPGPAAGRGREAPPPPARVGSLVGRWGIYLRDGERVRVVEDKIANLIVQYEDGEEIRIQRDSFKPE